MGLLKPFCILFILAGVYSQTQAQNQRDDISKEGECKAEIEHWCQDVEEGDSRLTQCITTQLQKELNGVSLGIEISTPCKEELITFKIERSEDLRENIPMLRACNEYIHEYCQADARLDIIVEDKNRILSCLHKHLSDVDDTCKKVIINQIDETVQEVNVVGTKDGIGTVCSTEIKQMCRRRTGQYLIKCLKRHIVMEGEDHSKNTTKFSSNCRQKVLALAKLQSGDIRLNKLNTVLKLQFQHDEMDHHLFHVCQKDINKHCQAMNMLDPNSKVNTLMLDCLTSAYESTLGGFSWVTYTDDSDYAGYFVHTGEQQQSNDEAKGLTPECYAAVHDRISLQLRDSRLDSSMGEQCYEDRMKFCSKIAQGSAAVLRCLYSNRDKLSKGCGAQILEKQRLMAIDLDFNYPLQQACSNMVQSKCSDTKGTGHMQQLTCLSKHIGDAAMSHACKELVVKAVRVIGEDVRLNVRLYDLCKTHIFDDCNIRCSGSEFVSCGKEVLVCLQELNVDKQLEQDCAAEVHLYTLLEVQDFRTDVQLLEDCRDDIQAHCSGYLKQVDDILDEENADADLAWGPDGYDDDEDEDLDIEYQQPPEKPDLHQCLQDNLSKLSAKCARHEKNLKAIQDQDLSLRPLLQRKCQDEVVLFCRKVAPGHGQLYKCLLNHINSAQFGQECRKELRKRETGQLNDYRANMEVLQSCESEIQNACNNGTDAGGGQAVVMKCLVEQFWVLRPECQTAVQNTVRLGLWDYQPRRSLTSDCDGDVEKLCQHLPGVSQHQRGVFSIGWVAQCLTQHAASKGMLTSLSPKCHKLMMVVVPTDVAEELMAQRKSGVLPLREGGSWITVKGWVAVLAIISTIAVAIGGIMMAIRTFKRGYKPLDTVDIRDADA